MSVRSVCIVGGGSSGWMMALALNKNAPDIDVTLVESSSIPAIGVGEATIPSTADFIKNVLGFEEKEWMPYCDASYKAGIKFNDFSKVGQSFYHPFWTSEEDEREGFDWAIKSSLTGESTDNYYASNYIAYHMMSGNKFDHLNSEGFSYAHHMDSNRFASFCKSKFTGNYVVATVHKVDSKGEEILAIHTDKGCIEADMFVDCTGFKALLIGKALGEPFESSSETLLNDSAITCRIPYKSKKDELQPYTECTALSSGWVWDTPLWSKIGTGYVYSSKFQTQESAESEFKVYLAQRFGAERADNAVFNLVRFRSGKYKRAWVGNCVALTLAAGFIEPLESTGLAFACKQIKLFIDSLSATGNSKLSQGMYNRTIDKSFNEIHDFVLTHYLNSSRDDSDYWRYIRSSMELPASVIDYMQSQDPKSMVWFPKKSRECVIIGISAPSEYSSNRLGWRDRPILSLNNEDKVDLLSDLTYLDEIATEYNQKAQLMVKLEDYLNDKIHHER